MMRQSNIVHIFTAAPKAFLLRISLLVALFAAGMTASQAGVMADRTRAIFSNGEQERTVTLINTNAYPVMVQSWVDNGEGSSAPDTIVSAMFVMPAVFRLQPKEIKTVRLLYTGDQLPSDRESAFWLNLYEIPLLPAGRESPDASRVLLGLNTQIKVFYRPVGIAPPDGDMADRLRFGLRRQGDQWLVVCTNPSPYFVSFGSLALELGETRQTVKQLADMMTPPHGRKELPAPVIARRGRYR